MGRKSKKHKKKPKDVVMPEPGSFKYGFTTRQNPFEFYHSYLERLKHKRAMKRQKKLEEKKDVS